MMRSVYITLADHRMRAAITGAITMRKMVSAIGIALFLRGEASALVVVEEVIDALCQFFVDAVHCFQLRQRRARDAAGGTEAIQQRALAGRADAADLVEW